MLENHLATFLAQHHDGKREVLLGLSGGPDSLALLYLLKDLAVPLRVAHVDHGWRNESATEASQLSALAHSLGIPFHCKRLGSEDREGNLEAAGRRARLQFFQELCSQYGCQAVLLGHQADDVIETLLKRLFEGVAMPYLNGLSPVIEIDGVVLWRPLLSVPKRDILDWLDRRGIVPFFDRTNEDPRFLRGRMRTEILPWLSEHFGKEVATGLRRLADEATELRHYLDEKIQPFLNKVVEGPLGLMLDLSESLPDTRYELRHLVRRVAEKAGVSLSREGLELITEQLISEVADKRVVMGSHTFICDRQRLFAIKPPSPYTEVVSLCQGDNVYGAWRIEVMESLERRSPDWRELWKGKTTVALPRGGYRLAPGPLNARLQLAGRDTTLGRWWSNHKVPAFLKPLVPVIWQGDRVYLELLTGALPLLPPNS